MKIITFVIPCHNCENYMEKCVDSLLKGGEDLEILIVNGGSQDETLAVAKSYEERFPSVVRVLDGAFGGRGDCINAALKKARGIYFKEFGPDDWADTHALKTLLGIIRTHLSTGTLPDLYLVNYVFENVARNTANKMGLEKQFVAGRRTGWKQVKKFRGAASLSERALVYKTETLKRSGLVLPTDETALFAYAPLPFAKTLFYLDVDLYRCFVGRVDPAAEVAAMAKQYGAIAEETLSLAGRFGSDELKTFPKGLRQCLQHTLANQMRETMLVLCAERSRERKEVCRRLWEQIGRDKPLWRKLRFSPRIFFVKLLPWRLRGKYLAYRYCSLCRRLKTS